MTLRSQWNCFIYLLGFLGILICYLHFRQDESFVVGPYTILFSKYPLTCLNQNLLLLIGMSMLLTANRMYRPYRIRLDKGSTTISNFRFKSISVAQMFKLVGHIKQDICIAKGEQFDGNELDIKSYELKEYFQSRGIHPHDEYPEYFSESLGNCTFFLKFS
jgi:hypothetical protein